MGRMKTFWCCIFFWFGFWGCSSSDLDDMPEVIIKSTNHPFLIVKKDQFAGLRQKAQSEPWKSMKEDAISRSNDGPNKSGSSSNQAYQLQYYTGAAALAHILDEPNATKHAARVRDAILNHYSTLLVKDGGDWGGVVPPMGSFFVAILSLDIVYDALSVEDIQACENVISNQIAKINREGSWADVRRGTHGTWDIYQGDRTEPDDDYYNGIMFQITGDGVSPVTIHYAWERVGGGDSRLSKSGYMDVLEFTGIDQRYYQNERLQKFQRWLFGSSINNSKEMAIIGDMLPTQGLNRYLLHERVVNFDIEAASYAAWFHEGKAPKGHILTYILPKTALPAPKAPESQIYPNGGAFFRENGENPDGMHVVLYNITSQDEWHTHQETNGLALSALGNRLLVNGGRLGAPTRPAALNNTLTLNGEDHQSRLGDGIVAGFTSNGLDYASGASGRALKNGTHHRHLILVHASEGAEPYTLIIDEVEALPGEKIHNYFHPANQTQVSEIEPGVILEAPIDHHATQSGSKLAFIFATPNNAVTVEKVPSAVPDRYPGYPDHNRLEAIYDIPETGISRILTLLYPHHHSQTLPVFTSIQNQTYSGGYLQHRNGDLDYMFASSLDTMQIYKDVQFQAKAVLFRETNGQTASYFICEGTHFSSQGIGLDADEPVSIHFKNNEGAVVSPGTQITLSGPGIQSIQFDPIATITNVGIDSIRVDLPEGTYTFQ
jgi:hypothetical protein